MPRWWSISLPPDFKDVSLEASKSPQVIAMLESRQRVGEATMQVYRSSEGVVLFVVDHTNTKYPAVSKGELERREETERASNASEGHEISYRQNETHHLVVGTQKATVGQTMTLQKRWTGIATDDSMRALMVLCTGPEHTCESLVGTVVVDESGFQALSALHPVTGEDLASMLALGAAGIGLLGAFFVMFRRRRRTAATASTPASP